VFRRQPWPESAVLNGGITVTSLEKYSLRAILIACGLSLTVGEDIGTRYGHARAAASGAEEIISRTMHLVYSDLKRMKSEFAQLRDIDRATVSIDRFDFETGILQHATRFKPEIFASGGCYIRLEVLYPATQDDLSMRQDGGGHVVSLRNGSSYAFWRDVRAETSTEGKEFVHKVNQIITSRLDAMKMELDQL